ncbi:MAG: hypothetical protein QOG91_244 [Candidatus Parcubacteria bacterium]|jgi:hypothetical protein|nr:hypothetical protein [Candidatus Parcubacteria bacterium]
MFSRTLAATLLYLATSHLAHGSINVREYDILPQQDILPNLPLSGHPRLLASQSDFEQLKIRAASDPILIAWHQKLKVVGDQALLEPPSIYDIPDGLRLLAVCRQVLGRIETLALLYRIDGDQKYLDRARAELDAAANFKDWNPRHFLDTAEMTRAFAIGYDWLYDAWTPEERVRWSTAIVEKGLKPGLMCYHGTTMYQNFPNVENNWNQVCNGGIGLGALAVADLEPAISCEILCNAINSIKISMAGFAPAGGTREGPSYWNYGTDYNVIFMAALKTALGSDFGLSSMDGFKDTGQFPIYMTGPFGLAYNYADASEYRIHAPQLLWLAGNYSQPEFMKFEVSTALPKPLDLLWYRTPVTGTLPNQLLCGLPLDKYFPGAEVTTFRSSWNNRNALFVGLKAGDNKVAHGHLDLGSFLVDALGKRWAVDIGGDDYNLPGYWSTNRWTYYRLRAEGHNALVIDPGLGPDQDPNAEAKITRFVSTPTNAFAITDLSSAYGHPLSDVRYASDAYDAISVRRGIKLPNRKSVVIEDEISAGRPRDVWWFMQTPASVVIDQTGTSAILTQDNVSMMARIASPANAKFTVMDAVPLPQTPHPLKQTANPGLRKLAVHLENVTDTRLVVLLIPLDAAGILQAAVKDVTIVPLDEW